MTRYALIGLMMTSMAACAPQVQGSGSIISVQQAPEANVDPADLGVDAFHESLAVYDSPLDTPAYFHSADYVFSERQTWEEDGTHVDYPRMIEGGLDGGIWVIFTRQGPLDEASYRVARTHGILRQAAIREFAAKYHDKVALAFTADDADRILADGKIVVFQSMENSYPLGTDVSLMETFYIGGLRMIAPVHFANNQFCG